METQTSMDFSQGLNPHYIAGLFDGEGSVSIARSSTPGEKILRGRPGYFYEKYFLQLSIVNTHRGILERVQYIYGGSLRQTTPVEGRRTCYVWALRGKHARRFLQDMLPLAHIKCEQMAMAIRFIDLPRGWNVEERKRIYAVMTALNGKRNHHRRQIVTPESLTRLRDRKVTITDDGVSLD